MSFNQDATLDTSQAETGGGGRLSGGMIPIGGGVGGIVLLVIVLIIQGLGGGTGGTTSPGLNPGGPNVGGDGSVDISQCRTGADANRDPNCRAIGTANSVQAYWATALPAVGKRYTKATLVLYGGAQATACGTASNQVGPFYCPLDKKVYLDVTFFDELTTRFGADNGALAQEYVVAHEYGHHVQDILGLLGRAQQDPQGATSGSVRIELMADCLAGVWANHAATTQDANGRTYLQPLTQRDIDSALSAASSVGDDRIQKKVQGQVNEETWTHGSSAERQRWFTTGYQTGDLKMCDTFAAKSL
ncbi:MAG: neutral zinc metallopeptidase [Actinomycetota bacterium]|nr:neutral zinc metallopeptidase [Actinomycetota bacterium]